MRPLVPLLVVATIGCNAPDRGPRWRETAATTPRDGGVLRFASQERIRTLDPAIAYDEVSIYALHHLLDTLVDYEPAGTRLAPRLAERWELSSDGLVYHFWLRSGLAYGDGRPLIAADFEFSLERVLRMPESPFQAMLADVAGVQDVIAGKATDCAGITAIGVRELEIRLARPNAAFLYVLAMPFAAPLRADHLATAGDRIRAMPLASGPYEVGTWDEGQRLVLRRRAHYHDRSRQHLDGIVLHEGVARDTQFLMFERGELETAERLSAPDYLWITQQRAWAPYVHTQAVMNVFGSRMNVRVKPFDDRRVRQALNYALDRRSISKLLNGTAVPAHGMLAPGAFGRDDSLAPYPYDPEKARALLREAGYPAGFSVQYVTLANEEAEKLAASLQHDLAKIGVRIEISLMSGPTYETAVRKPDGPAFSFTSWLADFPDPTSSLDPRFHSRGIADENASNDSFYNNPELDQLLDAARAEPDATKRAAMYRRAERILYDDAPWIWGYHQVTTEVRQPYVRDYRPHPMWLRDYTSAWLDLVDGEPVLR